MISLRGLIFTDSGNKSRWSNIHKTGQSFRLNNSRQYNLSRFYCISIFQNSYSRLSSINLRHITLHCDNHTRPFVLPDNFRIFTVLAFDCRNFESWWQYMISWGCHGNVIAMNHENELENDITRMTRFIQGCWLRTTSKNTTNMMQASASYDMISHIS